MITILGIMASIVTYGAVGQQRKARDAQRKSDLQTVKNAMETAKNDCSNAVAYPGITPSGSRKSSETYYFRLLPYLRSSFTNYLKTDINDPTFKDTTNGTGNYEIVRGVGAANTIIGSAAKCVNSVSGTNNSAGMTIWVIRAKLETGTADPESKKSYDTCLDKLQALTTLYWTLPIPAPNGDGYYYVCSE